jgi:hypothetical protein
MRWVSLCAVAAVAVAGLSGCGDGKKQEAVKVDRPARKAGLWEQTTTVKGAPAPQVLRLCTAPAVEATLPWWGGVAQMAKCRETAGKRNPDGTWSFESRCDLGAAGKVGLSGSGQGDFNSRYEVRIRTITAGAAEPKMNGQQELTNVFEWKGECPADWTPGDVEVGGGLRMNSDPGAVQREIEKAKAALQRQEIEAKAAAAAGADN